MSRAFVREGEETFDDLPERVVSPAPNWVTETGLLAIESELARLTSDLAHAGEDRYDRARIGRDLRYWKARRASAQLAPLPTDDDRVHFGSIVDIARAGDDRSTYRIVGEDEADPAKGTISYIAPLARALIGKSVGDEVRVNARAVEILTITH